MSCCESPNHCKRNAGGADASQASANALEASLRPTLPPNVSDRPKRSYAGLPESRPSIARTSKARLALCRPVPTLSPHDGRSSLRSGTNATGKSLKPRAPRGATRQNTQHALSLANRGYVLETGRVVMSGTESELLANEDVRKAYLGL